MPRRTGLPWCWGATAEEATADYPGDELAAAGAERSVRALDSRAAVERQFAWLGQLRAAPYSYDLLDNLGRRSPRRLTRPEPMEVGQTFARIFELAELEEGRYVVLRTKPGSGRRLFGPLVLGYHVRPAAQGSRLIGVVHAPYAGLMSWRLTMWLVMWGDLVMMRKQLRTLTDLAAQS